MLIILCVTVVAFALGVVKLLPSNITEDVIVSLSDLVAVVVIAHYYLFLTVIFVVVFC